VYLSNIYIYLNLCSTYVIDLNCTFVKIPGGEEQYSLLKMALLHCLPHDRGGNYQTLADMVT